MASRRRLHNVSTTLGLCLRQAHGGYERSEQREFKCNDERRNFPRTPRLTVCWEERRSLCVPSLVISSITTGIAWNSKFLPFRRILFRRIAVHVTAEPPCIFSNPAHHNCRYPTSRTVSFLWPLLSLTPYTSFTANYVLATSARTSGLSAIESTRWIFFCRPRNWNSNAWHAKYFNRISKHVDCVPFSRSVVSSKHFLPRTCYYLFVAYPR